MLAKYFIYWQPVTGQANITLDDATLVATGGLAIQGQLGVTLDDVTLVATGIVQQPHPPPHPPAPWPGQFVYLPRKLDDEDVLVMFHKVTK